MMKNRKLGKKDQKYPPLPWVLNQGEDIIPIVGMYKPKRVEEDLQALNIEITAEEMNILNETFKSGAFKGDRYPERLLAWVAS